MSEVSPSQVLEEPQVATFDKDELDEQATVAAAS